VTTKHQKEKEYRDKLKRMAQQAHAKREKEKREAEERNWKQYLVLPPVKQPHPLEQ
jgi:low affinity Fe/Cu permease